MASVFTVVTIKHPHLQFCNHL